VNVRRQLDEHDEAIIAVLREDGRMAVRDLAQRVGLTEATVRARIRRLEESGSMRIVAKLDLGAMGYPFVALVGLKIRGRTIDEVGQDLLQISEVISILSVIGRNDLEIQVIARDMAMLNILLTETIPAIDGIVGVESALAMNIVKYVQPWGRFA
jgi:Lrp/AsnC family transcriptional regulator for asnA, asnC and gidA